MRIGHGFKGRYVLREAIVGRFTLRETAPVRAEMNELPRKVAGDGN